MLAEEGVVEKWTYFLPPSSFVSKKETETVQVAAPADGE